MSDKQKRMKVLVISNMYPSRKSYLGIFVRIQTTYLQQRGIRIIKSVKRKSSLPAYLCYMIKTFILVVFANYDLVHAHYGFHSALIPALFKRKPLVITFHGGDALQEPFRNKIYMRLQKYVIRKADRLIAVSSQVKKFIDGSLGGNPGETSVISCGVDTSYFRTIPQAEARRRTGIPADAKVVLYAGKITFMKGLDVIYQCARWMPGVLFIIAGTPFYQVKTENCRYIGLIHNRDMPLWMSAADLYFLPSRSEGTPVGILEALSCQRPVIVSNIGGCPDLVTDGENGFLINVENPIARGVYPDENIQYTYTIPTGQLKDVVGKLKDLLYNQEKREIMGEKGREKVVRNYDNTVIAAKIHDVYLSVLKNMERRSKT